MAAQADAFVDDPILERGVVKAVDGVTVSLRRKKTLGVVGESGCG